MSEAYRSVPTAELLVMWAREKERIVRTGDEDFSVLLAMRRELDRRKGVRRPTVDVNFSKDYLTD